MHFSDDIDAIAEAAPDDFYSLYEVLFHELIDTRLEKAGAATLRKRHFGDFQPICPNGCA
ncbi:hypothetical protein [Vreelandella massiliensis]|uniref:hypothetical protein n=1 Tax=Vreelandella massiliensis TaxID=1816686 RepID=UPI00096A8FC0|nr:hypothetical protein [Halomonas massiliensis]